MNRADLVFALLFVAEAPATVASLGAALKATDHEIELALVELHGRLEESGPLQLVQLAGGIQLSTKEDYAEAISAFLLPAQQRLGRSLMEVLAIIAYRQPLTIAEIDTIRGVQSDYAIRALIERRLIAEIGKKPMPGRPSLYGTTSQFLHQFKLNDLSQLPELQLPLEFAEEETT